MRLLISILLFLFVISFVHPANAENTNHSKYSGQEQRAIKSLSPDDVAELQRGGGWGLAKAAELNGVPGPAHLLEMKTEIPLSSDQIEAISKIYDDMKTQAIKLGNRLIQLEKKLEIQFQKNTINNKSLKLSLSAIANVRAELRYVHLATHLETPKILSKEQIAKYNEMRGYLKTNPCDSVPSGHNAALWRKHNGCR